MHQFGWLSERGGNFFNLLQKEGGTQKGGVPTEKGQFQPWRKLCKIKSHGDEVTDFYDKKIPKVDSNHPCLAVISLDSARKRDENYYLQVFLRECKYIEKKVIRHINDNLSGFSSSDESGDTNEE